MSIVENHEIQHFGHQFPKTEILHQAIFPRKLTWIPFPVTSEFSDRTSNLHCKGFTSLLFTIYKTGIRNCVY